MYIMIYIYVGTNMTCYLCCFSKAAIVFAVQFPRWQHRCAYPFWVMSAHRQISQTPWVFLRFPAWVLSQRVDSLRRYNPCNLEKLLTKLQLFGFFCRPNFLFPTCFLDPESWGRRSMAGAASSLWLVTLPLTRWEPMLDSTRMSHLISHLLTFCHFLSLFKNLVASKPVSTERSTIVNQKDMGKHSRFVSTHSFNWNQATAMLPKFSQMHRFYKFQSGACDRFRRKSTSGTFRTSALPQKLLAPMNRVGQTSRASWSLGLQKLIIVDHGRSNSVSHTCSEMNARRMFFMFGIFIWTAWAELCQTGSYWPRGICQTCGHDTANICKYIKTWGLMISYV